MEPGSFLEYMCWNWSDGRYTLLLSLYVLFNAVFFFSSCMGNEHTNGYHTNFYHHNLSLVAV